MPDLKSQLEALLAKLAKQAGPTVGRIAENTRPTQTSQVTASHAPNPTQRQRNIEGHAPLQPAAKTNTQEARPLAAPTARVIGAATDRADPGKSTPRLDIVIGLDFGTRFTKVGYRIVGVDQPRIIVPNPAKPETALFKSVLFVDTQTMTVHRKRPTGSQLAIEELPYLKLLLKDFDQPTILVPLMLRKIVDPKSIKVFAAFYLAGVLSSAIATIAKNEAARLSGRRVFYALNVSLPADHFDDAASDRFREVGVVALRWA